MRDVSLKGMWEGTLRVVNSKIGCDDTLGGVVQRMGKMFHWMTCARRVDGMV